MIRIRAGDQPRLRQRTEIRLREVLTARDAQCRAQVGRRPGFPLEKLQKPKGEDIIAPLNDLRDIAGSLQAGRITLAAPVGTPVRTGELEVLRILPLALFQHLADRDIMKVLQLPPGAALPAVDEVIPRARLLIATAGSRETAPFVLVRPTDDPGVDGIWEDKGQNLLIH